MNWTLTTERQLNEHFTTTLNDFWENQVEQGTFMGKDNITVHYAWCIPAQARHTVVISSGRIESLLKYKELIYDLYQNGFAVFIPDHRGQGLSGRMTQDRQHGYVDSFDDYVDDLLAFCRDIVLPRQVGKRYLLCHSMGGAIGALTLIREPDFFDKAVLASPMFGVRPALPVWLSDLLIGVGLRWNRLRKRQSGYFFGQTPYVAFPYSLNKLTHSKIRYALFRQLYDDHPQIQLGGVTSEWLDAAQQAMDAIERHARTITTPLLVFSADGDTIIDNRRQRRVVTTIPDVTLKIIPHAHHELFNESDEYRNPVLSDIFDFFHADSA
ncbi:alpha/beta fold hydrolase [Alteromonas sp. CYL-A6]|uniref:alpha/beta fold hydrolase n=1 Tax=Alteromonas nitratireducens TaxID=3390813 RepID=UPI0034AF67B5